MRQLYLNFITGRGGLIFFYLGFAITLIYLNKDYSGFDGFANLCSNFFTLGGQINHDSCLSRKTSSTYSRPSPHKPSSYLLAKLQRYEILHGRCGADTRPYRRTINHLLKSQDRIYRNNNGGGDPVFMTECSYIIWKSAAGLGNQMISMVSAFLYALLTNRVLLVEFDPSLTDLFCEPFLNNIDTSAPSPSWILPDDFPYSKGRNKHLKTLESLINDAMRLNYTLSAGITVPPFVFVNLVSGKSDRANYFPCDETHHLLRQIPVLVTQSEQYYTPWIFMTPSFTDELERMFPEKTIVFHHLGRYLFHPSNTAWRRITEYYDAHMGKVDVRVGLQIRVTQPKEVHQQDVMEQILSCTINRSVLPPPPPPTAILTNNVGNRTNLTTAPQGTSSIAVLVASLFPEYASNLTAMYGQTPTPNGEVIRVYQPTSEGIQKFYNAQQNMNAWVEIYLLSLCDKLVTTGESTFGYVAAGLAALRPWVLRKPDKETSRSVSCLRATTIDPCCHFPPTYDCVARREVELGTLFPEKIKICEDRSFGIRLSDGD